MKKEENKKEETTFFRQDIALVEQRKFWLVIGGIILIFILFRYAMYSSWCKQNVRLIGGEYTYLGGYRYETYENGVSACRARWMDYIFKKHY